MLCFVFLFKQKTAYEMRISDWSSDVCSSDLAVTLTPPAVTVKPTSVTVTPPATLAPPVTSAPPLDTTTPSATVRPSPVTTTPPAVTVKPTSDTVTPRSEEHTSELQSLMRISYAVFCLKKKNTESRNKHKNTL